MISSTLTEKGRNKLCDLLQRNLDIFSWKHADMTGIPRHITEHRLNVQEGTSLPFFKTLKECTKKSDFHWTAEAEEASEIEATIASYPFIRANGKGGTYHYLAATKETKWSIELGEYAIHYRPRVSVKGQILADFIVERLEEDSPDYSNENIRRTPQPLICYTDGSSCTDGFSSGPDTSQNQNKVFWLRSAFDATTTKRKFEALITGLRIAEQMGVKNLQANVDSRLVANQVNGTNVAKEADMIRYLKKETLPADVKKARAVRRKSQRFAVLNGTLYKKSFLGPWLRCVGPLQANYVLREIHEGSCSMHAGTRSVVAKALRISYYWPTMQERKSRTHLEACQGLSSSQTCSKESTSKMLTSNVTSPWRSSTNGITIRPYSEGWPGKSNIRKFGLPGEIISDNGKQFRDNPFKDWCEKLCIRQHFASVKHPQTNGLFSHVQWAHRTMIKSSNRDTPFSLTYGTEAVIPAEIGMPTLRTAEVDLVQNNEALEINLDLLEEKREQAAIREAKSKAKIEKYYNSKVRSTNFKPRNLVYRNNDASRAKDIWKLGPKWKGPYEVTEALGKGAYKLRNRDEKQLPWTWNVSNLKNVTFTKCKQLTHADSAVG
ncbi:reverse transcriptase domain-containing protein [Tanacetum coccineum]